MKEQGWSWSRPRPALALLVLFVLVATLLPFAALPLPGGNQVRVALLALIVFHAGWLVKGISLSRLDRAVVAALGVFVGLVVLAFLCGVWSYGYTPEAGLAAANLTISVLVLLGVRQTVRTSPDVRMLVRLFLLASVFAAVVGLVLWMLPAVVAERALLGLVPMGYPDGPEVIRIVYGTDLERATGTSVDANLFGGLMMLGATLLAGQLLAGDAILPRRVVLLGFAAVLAALALSFSRSAWVGTGVGLLYLGVFVERRALAVLAVGLVIALLMPQMRDRLVGAIAVQDAASVMRVDEYRESARVIAEHPFIGVGFGPAYGLNLVRRVSNMYLLIAEEMGLAGLASLLVLLGLVGWHSLRSSSASEVGLGVLAGLRAALLACLVAGLFDHYFMNSLFPHTVALFWLVAGLLLAAATIEQAPVEGERRLGHGGPGEPGHERASSLG